MVDLKIVVSSQFNRVDETKMGLRVVDGGVDLCLL